jgi:CHASE3 domain sensor protein
MRRAALKAEVRRTLPFLTIAVILLGFGSWRVLAAGNEASDDQRKIRDTQTARSAVLEYQLDEETGIRGYAATRVPLFLEPYLSARVKMTNAFAALDSTLGAVGNARLFAIAPR